MPTALPPEQRDAIVVDIRDAQLGRNQIARRHGVSGDTVTRLAKQVESKTGRTAFDRAATKKALAARNVEQDVRHAELVGDLLADAEMYRRVLAAEVAKKVSGEARNLVDAVRAAVVMGVTIDRYVRLRRLDNPAGAQQGAALLEEFLDSLYEEDGDDDVRQTG